MSSKVYYFARNLDDHNDIPQTNNCFHKTIRMESEIRPHDHSLRNSTMKTRGNFPLKPLKTDLPGRKSLRGLLFQCERTATSPMNHLTQKTNPKRRARLKIIF
jgi:hypothetical protein